MEPLRCLPFAFETREPQTPSRLVPPVLEVVVDYVHRDAVYLSSSMAMLSGAHRAALHSILVPNVMLSGRASACEQRPLDMLFGTRRSAYPHGAILDGPSVIRDSVRLQQRRRDGEARPSCPEMIPVDLVGCSTGDRKADAFQNLPA